MYDERDDVLGDPDPDRDANSDADEDPTDPAPSGAKSPSGGVSLPLSATLATTNCQLLFPTTSDTAVAAAVIAKVGHEIATRYHRLEGLEALADALGTSSLTSLSLNACGLDTKSFQVLRDHLLASQGSCGLRWLSLAQNMDGEERASMAVKEIIVNNCLDSLDLSGTNAPIAERAILALEHLNVASCELGDSSVEEAYRALMARKNAPLRRISFSGNPLTRYGLESATAMIKDSIAPALQELELSSVTNLTEWPDNGVLLCGRIGQAFATNTSIRALRLAGNGIGETAAQALLNGLKMNHTLKVLDLEGNGLSTRLLSSFYHQSLTVML